MEAFCVVWGAIGLVMGIIVVTDDGFQQGIAGGEMTLIENLMVLMAMVAVGPILLALCILDYLNNKMKKG